MKSPRVKKRASSRAKAPCPHCNKKLHGENGIEEHLKQVHRV